MGALADIAISQKGGFGIQKFALGGYEEMWQEGSFDCKLFQQRTVLLPDDHADRSNIPFYNFPVCVVLLCYLWIEPLCYKNSRWKAHAIRSGAVR